MFSPHKSVYYLKLQLIKLKSKCAILLMFRLFIIVCVYLKVTTSNLHFNSVQNNKKKKQYSDQDCFDLRYIFIYCKSKIN